MDREHSGIFHKRILFESPCSNNKADLSQPNGAHKVIWRKERDGKHTSMAVKLGGVMVNLAYNPNPQPKDDGPKGPPQPRDGAGNKTFSSIKGIETWSSSLSSLAVGFKSQTKVLSDSSALTMMGTMTEKLRAAKDSESRTDTIGTHA